MTSDEETECCCICLAPLDVDTPRTGKNLPCNHAMHGQCLLRWLTTQPNPEVSLSCPLCRCEVDRFCATMPTSTNWKRFDGMHAYEMRAIRDGTAVAIVIHRRNAEEFVLSIYQPSLSSNASLVNNVVHSVTPVTPINAANAANDANSSLQWHCIIT